MKNVLLTTPYGPYDAVWGTDPLDVMGSRLARGHDFSQASMDLPSWALYLVAENISHPCTVLEYPRWDDFARELDCGYDIVGIELKTIHTERVARMVELIRERHPKTEIVIGGYGVSALDDTMPGDTNGYAQYLKDSAHHLCREEGVRFMRRLLGEPEDGPITQFHLPWARHRLTSLRSAFELKFPAVLVALGCPSACEFCNTSAFFRHKKIYVAEPEETYRFLRSHCERLGGDTMTALLFDEDLFQSPEYVRELGRLIRSDRKTWGIRWFAFASVSTLSPFEPEELRECGVGAVWIGVESGISEGGRSKTGYKKREGAKSPQEIFAGLQRYGIETIGSMILGFDFHTRDNIVEDIDFFVSLKPTFYQIAPLSPCPGTKLYRRMKKAGRIYSDYDYTKVQVWKDDVFALENFSRGEMKKYYDLAHEKLRATNGSPALQMCEANLMAYETLRDSPSEFLRFQAEQARKLAAGSLPIVRSIGHHPPSPKVLRRVREIEARAQRVLDPPSLPMRAVGKAVELLSDWRADRRDALDQSTGFCDPGVRWTYYNRPGTAAPVRRTARWRRLRALAG